MDYKNALVTPIIGADDEAGEIAGSRTSMSQLAQAQLIAAANSPSNVKLGGGSGPMPSSVGEATTCYSWDDNSETILKFDGKSWTITRKDIRSGSIEKFTQSGSGALGRVEIFQGKGAGVPRNAPMPDSLSALKRKTFAWEGVEDQGTPLVTSPRLVPLPRSMWSDVEGTMITAPGSMGEGMENLLSASAREGLAHQRHAGAAKTDATAHSQTATPKTPSPSFVPGQ